MSQPRSIFWPLFLIAAGVIWLLTKAGTIPTANLWALTHIWPYFLIAAGVGLILRPYWQYANILIDILIIGGAVFSIWYAPQFGWDNPAMGFVFIDNNSIHVGPGEPGSGNVITEKRDVNDFTAIELDYPAQVTVRQGESVSVKIEAEDNVLPGLQTRVRGETLEVSYRSNDGKYVNPTKTVKITIVVKDLKDVEITSAGQLYLEGIKTDELDISVSGAGDLNLEDIVALDLSLNLSGAGNVTSSGDVDDFQLDISGFGNYNGKDLHCKTARINLSGAGSAAVWVDDQLDVQISGAGSVNYYGSPSVTKQVSGLGTVSKSGDK